MVGSGGPFTISATNSEDSYARLGLPPTANAAEIKAAYRRRAKELHPDRNPDADAPQQFQALNETYLTLIGAELRAARPRYRAAEAAVALNDLEPVGCSKCGEITVQPRYAVYRYVVGVLIVANRKSIQGVYCAQCAKAIALKASLISAFTGWWAYPWGPVYTISEILRNAAGGDEPQGSREGLLLRNTLAFLNRGENALAYELAQELRAAEDENIAATADLLLDYLQSKGVPAETPASKPAWKPTPKDYALHGFLAFAPPLLALVVGAAMFTKAI